MFTGAASDSGHGNEASKYRMVEGLTSLFKLQYDTKLRTGRVRNHLLNALVRGSTHIQRAMTRSAGLMLDPRSQATVEPVVFRSQFSNATPVNKASRERHALAFWR